MKKLIIFLTPFVIFLFVLISLQLPISTNAQYDEYTRGELLVKFKQNTPQKELGAQLKNNNAQIVDTIKELDVLIVQVPEYTEERVLNALSNNPHVEYVELNGRAYASFTPNDAYFAHRQWGLENTGQTINNVTGTIDADIDASAAWDTTQGDTQIAILDTGVSQDHEDLSSQIIANKDFTGSTSGYNDINGHGTHTAGIAGAVANNGIGVAGGCPQCLLMNGKVLNDSGSGAYSWIANGIIWAADNGAQVISMSLGGSTKSTTLERAVNYAWNKGVVLVAAAGNSGNPSKSYPAAYTNVIAVAATNNRDQKASFSNYGAKWVDIAAPGVDIFSTWNNSTDRYRYLSGTSMSTPFVASVAGLVWSTSYGTSPTAVRSRIEGTADKISGTGKHWSAGRVNAAKAVGSP